MDTSTKPSLEDSELQPNTLLLSHYTHLGLTDPHLTLILHIMSRSPGQDLSDFPMSANLETRRRYVRDLRVRGLLFTAQIFTETGTGVSSTTAWYLGSLFHNLNRINQWLNAGCPLEAFQVEIPINTVVMFLKGKFHDTAPEIAQAIRAQTQNGVRVRPVIVPLTVGGMEKVKRQRDRVGRDQEARRRRYEFGKRRALMKKLLINRDGYKCTECGITQNLTIDHKIPISEGGTDELGNLQFLCLRHNSQKGKRMAITELQRKGS